MQAEEHSMQEQALSTQVQTHKPHRIDEPSTQVICQSPTPGQRLVMQSPVT